VLDDEREKVGQEGKVLAVLLYSAGKSGYGFIVKLFNVSGPAVLKWMWSMGKRLPEPGVDSEIKEVQIDEMWHFINKKKRKIWIWMAMDRSTNKTIEWVIGDRFIKTAKKLYEEFKHFAVFYVVR